MDDNADSMGAALNTPPPRRGFADGFHPIRTEQMARAARDCAVARVRQEHGPLGDRCPDGHLDRYISELVDLGVRLALEQFTAMARVELNVIDAAERLKFEELMMRPPSPIFMGLDLARPEPKKED